MNVEFVRSYSSSIRVMEIHKDNVGVSSNRKLLCGFRTFCTGQGVWRQFNHLLLQLSNVIHSWCQFLYQHRSKFICSTRSPFFVIIPRTSFWGQYSVYVSIRRTSICLELDANILWMMLGEITFLELPFLQTRGLTMRIDLYTFLPWSIPVR